MRKKREGKEKETNKDKNIVENFKRPFLSYSIYTGSQFAGDLFAKSVCQVERQGEREREREKCTYV